MKLDPKQLRHPELLHSAFRNRRHLLKLLAGASVLPIVGCGGDDDPGADSSEAGAGGGSGLGSSGSGATTAGTGSGSGGTGSSSSWATGGTASMVDKSSYPDPFSSGADACQLVTTTTEGPCTTATDLEREDISEEWTGLPLRLGLKVVDTSCNAVVGATVKIWHTNIAGSYSGETPNNNMCLKDQEYASVDFFRGVQTTDDDGIVYFDSCFPGWYNSRAVHIHFQVKQGGTSYRVSQLFFPEDVTEDIFANHEEYSSYGQPDTTFSNDNVMASIATSDRDRHILTVARMTDGAMLGSKVITVT